MRLAAPQSRHRHRFYVLYFAVEDSDNTTTTTSSKRCECVNQCNLLTYSATLSTARLTDTEVWARDRHRSRIGSNFMNALETAERVDENSMLETVQLLQGVAKAHGDMTKTIRFYVETAGTSVMSQLKMFHDAVLMMLDSTLRSSRDMGGEMDNVYSVFGEYLITDVTSEMEVVDRMYDKVITSFVAGHYSNNMKQSLIQRLESLLSKLASFDDTFNATSAYAIRLFPKRLLSASGCLTVMKSLNSTLVDRKAWLAGFRYLSRFSAKKELTKLFDVRSLMSRSIRCMRAYKVELYEFSRWIGAVRLPKISSGSLSTSRIELVEKEGKDLYNILQLFVNGSMTKAELVQQYLTNVDKRINGDADGVVTQVMKNVFNQLITKIDGFKMWMNSFFKTLFDTYINLQKYMDSADKGIENYARKQDIWRQPVVDFQSSQVN